MTRTCCAGARAGSRWRHAVAVGHGHGQRAGPAQPLLAAVRSAAVRGHHPGDPGPGGGDPQGQRHGRRHQGQWSTPSAVDPPYRLDPRQKQYIALVRDRKNRVCRPSTDITALNKESRHSAETVALNRNIYPQYRQQTSTELAAVS